MFFSYKKVVKWVVLASLPMNCSCFLVQALDFSRVVHKMECAGCNQTAGVDLVRKEVMLETVEHRKTPWFVVPNFPIILCKEETSHVTQ